MIVFPYIEFLGLAEERIFRPMIPMTFRANGKEFKTYSLIDSGSDYNVLPIEIAGVLKLKISDQPRYSILGAGGNSFTIYKSPVEVEHSLQKCGFRDVKWKSFVYFAESGSTILLGQNGFLNRLKVVLNGKNKKVEIVP